MTIRHAQVMAAAFVALGGCDRSAPVADPPAVAANEPVAAANSAAPAPRAQAVSVPAQSAAAAGPTSAFTSIDPARCELIAQNAEEAGYSRHRCVGAAGYRVEVIESDLRQNIALIRRDGSSSPLDLPSLVGRGGFNSLGPTAEWRGTDPRRPRTLTVRYAVNEDPDPAVAPRSYLVLIRLAAPACVVARVAAGARQSDEAREIADAARLPVCIGA